MPKGVYNRAAPRCILTLSTYNDAMDTIGANEKNTVLGSTMHVNYTVLAQLCVFINTVLGSTAHVIYTVLDQRRTLIIKYLTSLTGLVEITQY